MHVTPCLMAFALSLTWGVVVNADGPWPDRPAPFAESPAAQTTEASTRSSSEPARRRLFDRFRAPRVADPKPHEVLPPSPAEPQSVATPPPARIQPVNRGASDPRVRQTQAALGDLNPPALPGASLPISNAGVSGNPASLEGGQSLSMEAALYGAITNNPDLVALRQNNVASPEAVEVARQFPITLNPTLWVDVRPYGGERIPGGIGPNGKYHGPGIDHKDALYYFSLRQPIELGHQTTHRHNIAKAAYSQQQWNVVQAELTALVQTYRFYQTAAYRREKLRVAKELSEFNGQLLETLKRRLGAGQVPASSVSLATVETQATEQLAEAAQQDYVTALTDLRNQLGQPESSGTAEPLGEFVLPGYIPEIEDQELINLALQSRPEIRSAQAGIAGSKAALCLARADSRHSTPVVGPVYERDEQGTQFFGFVYITQLRVFNNGKPLVRQREADLVRSSTALDNAQRRVASQVTSAVVKWNGANRLVGKTAGLTEELAKAVDSLERQFDAGQTDLTTLFQARQRLIQLENARLDATWAATQAQADLLLALGAPNLIDSLRSGGDGGNIGPTATPPSSSSPSPFQPATGSPAPPQ